MVLFFLYIWVFKFKRCWLITFFVKLWFSLKIPSLVCWLCLRFLIVLGTVSNYSSNRNYHSITTKIMYFSKHIQPFYECSVVVYRKKLDVFLSLIFSCSLCIMGVNFSAKTDFYLLLDCINGKGVSTVQR